MTSMTAFSPVDLDRMDEALALARGQLGLVWPNPAVGCVIWTDEHRVGQGATQVGGRPHAEVVAVGQAGDAARGGTAYVSLEPCNHWGKTPPCVDALLRAGVARVVVAIQDPDPRTNGKGLARLAAGGVEVMLGARSAVAAEINAGFFMRIHEGRPLIATQAVDAEVDPTSVGFDAVMRLLDDSDVPVFEVRTGGPRTRRWVVAPPDTAVFGGQPVAYTPGATAAASLRSALAAIGALGLTRVVVPTDNALCRSLDGAGLLDRPGDPAGP